MLKINYLYKRYSLGLEYLLMISHYGGGLTGVISKYISQFLIDIVYLLFENYSNINTELKNRYSRLPGQTLPYPISFYLPVCNRVLFA